MARRATVQVLQAHAGSVRTGFAETLPHHADAMLRTRSYDLPWQAVFDACVRAAEELDTLHLAEADPRRGTIVAHAKLVPFRTLPVAPPGEHPPTRYPWARGVGWFRQFDPKLAVGWLHVRVDAGPKGATLVSAQVRTELPLSGPLAALLLKNYLRWLDIRLGMPRKP